MRVLSWNVQWCCGLDGVVDPARIAAEARRLADPDVLCLQEVAARFPELPGSQGENQLEEIQRALPGHQAFSAFGVDIPGNDGARRRFGNAIFSRLPAGRVLRHSLPWPAAPDVPSTPRMALEAVVETPFGALRVITTHLEYYSAEHRAAQIARLGEIHLQALSPHLPVSEEGPFRSYPRPASAILCGDFNLPPDDPLHDRILELGFVDAWQALYPGKPHQHTFRVHEREAGESPYCCDFVFLTGDLAPRLRSLRIDDANRASDHQPVIVELG
jgi:endonuclease/exonuclease/phosphatase family metal-dependent hydrolase